MTHRGRPVLMSQEDIGSLTSNRPIMTDEVFVELEWIASRATPPPRFVMLHGSADENALTGKSAEMEANALLYAAAHELLAYGRHWRSEARRLQEQIALYAGFE